MNSKSWAVGFAMLAVTIIAIAAKSRSLPSDEALRERFLKHRPEFEQLVKMANEDSRLSRISPEFTWLNDDVAWPRKDVGITEVRWNDYRKIFRAIGVSEGIISYKSPTLIFFPITSTGLVPSGVEKGLVYSQAELSPVLASLDESPPVKSRNGPDRSNVLYISGLRLIGTFTIKSGNR